MGILEPEIFDGIKSKRFHPKMRVVYIFRASPNSILIDDLNFLLYLVLVDVIHSFKGCCYTVQYCDILESI